MVRAVNRRLQESGKRTDSAPVDITQLFSIEDADVIQPIPAVEPRPLVVSSGAAKVDSIRV